MKKTLKKYKNTKNNKTKHHRKQHKKHNHHKRHKYHKKTYTMRKNFKNRYQNLKSRKRFNMKGGAAAYIPQGTASNISSVNIGGSHSNVTSSYNKAVDKPSGTISYVNYSPQPVLNAVWGLQTNIKNFFNELMGQPKQYTSSPTDQPIANINNPYKPDVISKSDVSSFKQNLLTQFNK